MTIGREGGRSIRVVLADDHPVVLAGIRSLLLADPEIEVIGGASDGVAALALITELLPDVAVLDISMPGMNGLELTRVSPRIARACA